MHQRRIHLRCSKQNRREPLQSKRRMEIDVRGAADNFTFLIVAR